MMENMPENYKKNLYNALMLLLIVLSVSIVVGMFRGGDRHHSTTGGDMGNTITLSGHGEVQAVPDIANVYFTIQKEAKTVKEAQDGVAATEKQALDALKAKDVNEKDIQTSNSSFNPKYEYVYDTKALYPCTQFNCPPRPGKNTITGYEASESITVKVRNADSVGDIMQVLGTVGVTDLSGPNFSIDNEDGLKAEARKKAIDDAETKAKSLAKDLGVKLGDISSFSESGGAYPVAYMAKDTRMMNESAAAAPAVIPKGENTISSDVTITYEIK